MNANFWERALVLSLLGAGIVGYVMFMLSALKRCAEPERPRRLELAAAHKPAEPESQRVAATAERAEHSHSPGSGQAVEPAAISSAPALPESCRTSSRSVTPVGKE